MQPCTPYLISPISRVRVLEDGGCSCRPPSGRDPSRVLVFFGGRVRERTARNGNGNGSRHDLKKIYVRCKVGPWDAQQAVMHTAYISYPYRSGTRLLIRECVLFFCHIHGRKKHGDRYAHSKRLEKKKEDTPCHHTKNTFRSTATAVSYTTDQITPDNPPSLCEEANAIRPALIRALRKQKCFRRR